MDILKVCVGHEKEILFKEASDDNGIQGKAVFAKKQKNKKRYFLEKRWAKGDKILTAIMMNPSKANEARGDATVNQLIEQAKKQKYDALYVVNISPIIEGSSKNLKMSAFNYDQLNWIFIKAAIEKSNLVFLGWGMKGQKGLKKQLKSNLNLYCELKSAREKFVCYELIQSLSKNKYNPKKYVPHPRPWGNKKKYVNKKFVKLTEFESIFITKSKKAKKQKCM